MARGPMDLWNEWATQILVLLSFTLQLVLLLFAGIRRREAPPVLTLLLWLAYQLADSTAIYAIGHLSLAGAPPEHQLVAFWAPFLLLHLGGPDNITAYALEDSKLWLRHLLTLVVQVLGAAYVLYKHIAVTGPYVVLAAILMFSVGVAKYGERTWALRWSNMDSIRSSLKKKPRIKCHFQLDDKPPRGGFKEDVTEEEFLVRRAHSLFHICKCATVDLAVDLDSANHDAEILDSIKAEEKHVWTLMELELSLMYDILYTKAAVIHTSFGYCIRLISPVATAASLLLFHFTGKNGHNGIDVAITYVLLGGALVLETTSLLNALGSSWTFSFLCTTQCDWIRHAVLCSGRWDRLRGAVVLLHRLLKATGLFSGYCTPSRRWYGKMGQYNVLHFCTRHDTRHRRRGPLLGRLARLVGQEELWDRKHFSGAIDVPEEIKELAIEYIYKLPKKWEMNTAGVIRTKWGKLALKKWNLWPLKDDNIWVLGVELQDCIITWHIATDVFLTKSMKAKDDASRVAVIRALSNYMMFLLVDRPDMLPGLAQNRLFQLTCQNLSELWDYNAKNKSSTTPRGLFRLRDDPTRARTLLTRQEELAQILLEQDPDYSVQVPRLCYVVRIAKRLLRAETDDKINTLEMLLDLWTDLLVYTANRCSRESHAKKLSSGGELTTVLWLLAGHLHQYQVSREHRRA